MLIALVAAAALGVAPAPKIDDPAALLPADTLIYFGTHSVQASAAANSKSAMHLILGEPEVKAFMQKPVAGADRMLKALLDDAGADPAQAERLSVSKLMAGESVAPIGKLFVALTHVGLPVPGDGQLGAPDVGLIVGVELLDANDLGLVRQLWDKIPLLEETGSHSGQAYFQKTSPEGMVIGLSFVGNLAIVSMSMKSLRAALDRAAGQGASLAEAADYAKLVTTAGGIEAGGSSWIVRAADVSKLIRGVMSMALAMEAADEPELSGKLLAVYDSIGLDALTWLGGVSHRDLAGRVHSTSAVHVDPSIKGLIGDCLGAGMTLDAARLDSVPANCLSMTAGSIDVLPPIYDFAMKAVETFAAEEFGEIQAMIKGVMGEYDLRNDLLANVHGAFLSYSMPGEGFPGTPTSVMRMEVRDGERFLGAISQLASGLSAMFFAGQPVTLKTSEHETWAFNELDISRTPLAMSMMQPAFVIDGQELVMSLESGKALKTALNGLGGATPLSKNADLAAFVASAKRRGELSALTYSDNARTFGALYGQVAGMAGMMAGGLGDLPVDLALMPSEQSITKHLTSSYSAAFTMDGGRTYVGVSESQFQVSDFMPLAVLGGMLVASVATGESIEAPPVELDPAERVQRDLAEIKAGMTVYKLAENRYPDSIADLIKPLADFPEGCLNRDSVPVDPWGNAYSFRLNEKGKPVVWSFGPNGVDDSGSGDDIVKG